MKRYFISYQAWDKKRNNFYGNCIGVVNRFDIKVVTEELIKKNNFKSIIIIFFKELKRYETYD